MELYRKYRPGTFDSVIGQNHIVKTLINQVEKNRVGHAYLFTGTRGTGKTTCAKIFARAINCLSPVNGSPCGECEACRALNGNNLDIIEMDAASNNGVDHIRDIIDRLKYPPVNGKYKVYIIDEVHMLSPGAFNAFLKTLEEPPSYVVFILATTEIHKLPQTIISRCMRFDFRLVPSALIGERIKQVYDSEGIEYDEDVIPLLSDAGEGSVRDALTIADRCVREGERITYDDVTDILGTSKRQEIYALFDAIITGDVGETLKNAENIGRKGKIMSVVAKDLISFAKDVLLAKTTGKQMLRGSEDAINQIMIRAERCSVNSLVSVIKIFSSVDADLRYSVSPLVTFEMTAVRAARLYDSDVSAIEERIARIERNGITIADHSTQAPAQDVEQKKNDDRPMDAIGIWGRLTTYFRRNESMSFYTVAGQQNRVKIEDRNLVVEANTTDYDMLMSQPFRDAVDRAFRDDGVTLSFVVERRKTGVNMDKEAERMKKLSGNVKFNIIKK